MISTKSPKLQHQRISLGADDGSGLDMFWGKKANITEGYCLCSNHLEEESEGGQEIHGGGWRRTSETSLVGGVGEKQHKWQGREKNGGTLSVPCATLGAKRSDDDDHHDDNHHHHHHHRGFKLATSSLNFKFVSLLPSFV